MGNLETLFDRSFSVMAAMDAAVSKWSEAGDESDLEAMFAKAAKLIVVDGTDFLEGEVVLVGGEYLCTAYGMTIPFNPVAEIAHSQILAAKLNIEFGKAEDGAGDPFILGAVCEGGDILNATYASACPIEEDDSDDDIELSIVLSTLAIALQIAEDRE